MSVTLIIFLVLAFAVAVYALNRISMSAAARNLVYILMFVIAVIVILNLLGFINLRA